MSVADAAVGRAEPRTRPRRRPPGRDGRAGWERRALADGDRGRLARGRRRHAVRWAPAPRQSERIAELDHPRQVDKRSGAQDRSGDVQRQPDRKRNHDDLDESARPTQTQPAPPVPLARWKATPVRRGPIPSHLVQRSLDRRPAGPPPIVVGASLRIAQDLISRVQLGELAHRLAGRQARSCSRAARRR